MATSRAHKVQDLAADDRHVVERLLGRSLNPDDVVELSVPSPRHVIKEAPTGEERNRAFDRLSAHFAMVDERVKDVPEEELEAAIEEALRSTRPSYRSVQ